MCIYINIIYEYNVNIYTIYIYIYKNLKLIIFVKLFRKQLKR